MNLAIDIGNTKIKTGWFEGEKLQAKQENISVDELKHLINAKNPSFVIGSSTARELFEDEDWKKNNFLSVSSKLKLPFYLKYKTPETLGADRLAAVAGGQKLFPGRNILVIDAGTCITYDFLDEKNNYMGGAISPGAGMRFKAMNHFTARLPQINIPSDFPDPIGNSTASCMESGVMNGIFFEIQNFIRSYTPNGGKIQVIITGGDAKHFDKKFKGHIFAAPDLVLVGLNVILQYNVESI
ncbi:MAG: type III pantothenate kinase [Candidatus Cyclobacteriaceae bacterium M2_1C_046]